MKMFGHSSVKRLMSYRENRSNGRDPSEEIHWSEKIIKNLVKKLKSSEIREIEHALSTKNQYTKCICIPRWVHFFFLSPFSLAVVLSAVVAISHRPYRRHMYVHIILFCRRRVSRENNMCVWNQIIHTYSITTPTICARDPRIFHTGNKEIWEDEIFAALFGSLFGEYETEICVMILEKMLFLKDDDDRHRRELGFRERLKLIFLSSMLKVAQSYLRSHTIIVRPLRVHRTFPAVDTFVISTLHADHPFLKIAQISFCIW